VVAVGRGAVAASPQIVQPALRVRTDEPDVVQGIRVRVDRPGGDPTFPDDDGSPQRRLALTVTAIATEAIEPEASTDHSTVGWTADIDDSGPHGRGTGHGHDHGHGTRSR
jgi:hypothetical protein